ncbi:hypothetical protein O6H91_09G015000 [Diphasiastrum complanatum]|uniref:Uncharacterized protein n=1 Tax=Diphasiastrum complanatum TaxID=34168 RepID=A0ACC2CLM6_DIPCM|nr:hypothetical protein O6H91_09G015000 [Diphasiastrum complanatum]
MAAPALSTPFQPYVYQSPQAAVTPFQILGGEAQIVQVMLKPQDHIVSRSGSLCYMSGSIQVEPTIPNENEAGGFWQWLFGKVNPTTTFVNIGPENGYIGLSAPSLARILPIDLPMFGGEITCQRGAYLCSINDVTLATTTTHRARAGFFGGEGFLMQKLVGQGLAFITAGGSVVQKNLAQGEVLVVDAGCVLAMTSSVKCELKYAASGKWAFLGVRIFDSKS